MLVATAEHDVNVYKSARNIDRVTVSPVAELNALAVLQPQRLLVTKAALDAHARRARHRRSQRRAIDSRELQVRQEESRTWPPTPPRQLKPVAASRTR